MAWGVTGDIFYFRERFYDNGELSSHLSSDTWHKVSVPGILQYLLRTPPSDSLFTYYCMEEETCHHSAGARERREDREKMEITLMSAHFFSAHDGEPLSWQILNAESWAFDQFLSSLTEKFIFQKIKQTTWQSTTLYLILHKKSKSIYNKKRRFYSNKSTFKSNNEIIRCYW